MILRIELDLADDAAVHKLGTVFDVLRGQATPAAAGKPAAKKARHSHGEAPL